jgi:hypothetical protein
MLALTMSALGGEADVADARSKVCLWPKADIVAGPGVIESVLFCDLICL